MAFLFPEIYLIDGENLVARYQAMLKSGRTPKPGLVHIRDVLVWHPSLIGAITGDIRRVLYYASAVGDDAYIAKIEGQIRCFEYSCSDGILRRRSHVMSRVFKKLSKSQKSRSVDINITIDSLRYARGGHAGVIVLYSGDGDFAPLIQEITHSGAQVHVHALSSGLSPLLERCADQFAILDDKLFEPENA